jgi:hypothetical protein
VRLIEVMVPKDNMKSFLHIIQLKVVNIQLLLFMERVLHRMLNMAYLFQERKT